MKNKIKIYTINERYRYLNRIKHNLFIQLLLERYWIQSRLFLLLQKQNPNISKKNLQQQSLNKTKQYLKNKELIKFFCIKIF